MSVELPSGAQPAPQPSLQQLFEWLARLVQEWATWALASGMEHGYTVQVLAEGQAALRRILEGRPPARVRNVARLVQVLANINEGRRMDVGAITSTVAALVAEVEAAEALAASAAAEALAASAAAGAGAGAAGAGASAAARRPLDLDLQAVLLMLVEFGGVAPAAWAAKPDAYDVWRALVDEGGVGDTLRLDSPLLAQALIKYGARWVACGDPPTPSPTLVNVFVHALEEEQAEALEFLGFLLEGGGRLGAILPDPAAFLRAAFRGEFGTAALRRVLAAMDRPELSPGELAQLLMNAALLDWWYESEDDEDDFEDGFEDPRPDPLEKVRQLVCWGAFAGEVPSGGVHPAVAGLLVHAMDCPVKTGALGAEMPLLRALAGGARGMGAPAAEFVLRATAESLEGVRAAGFGACLAGHVLGLREDPSADAAALEVAAAVAGECARRALSSAGAGSAGGGSAGA